MKAAQIIKENGFKTKRIDTTKFKGVFGGNCNHVIGLVNDQNEILCYEGRPYFPAGKIEVFASLISSGSISSECFSFQKITF